MELWGFSNLENSEVISEFYIALKSNCLVRDTSQQYQIAKCAVGESNPQFGIIRGIQANGLVQSFNRVDVSKLYLCPSRDN